MSNPELSAIWWELLGLLYVVSATAAAVHALLKKAEPQSALAWVGLIFLSPFLGTVLYLLFGINRIKRRALKLREKRLPSGDSSFGASALVDFEPTPLMHFGETICKSPLRQGNCVTPLINGDEAYPAMLAAIESAANSISLATYIFDNDQAGKRFLSALQAAQARGVKLRILVDGVGVLYSLPPISRLIRKAGIPFATFLPQFPPWLLSFSNLRFHRKLMIVDGKTAFAGGMNISIGHWHAISTKHLIRDVHFAIEGPVVAELQEMFINDWYFASGETLHGSDWLPPLENCGNSVVRAISDGPDENYGKIRWMLLGAIAEARQSIRIMTPYFTPDTTLIAALNTAALRGVKVEILLPSTNNLPWMHWAMQALIGELVEKGCCVYSSSPPFEHTKLMAIDSQWTMFGSANWDMRSLRLNFELNIECYDPQLNAELNGYVSRRIAEARRVDPSETARMNLPARIRNGIARLFLPVL